MKCSFANCLQLSLTAVKYAACMHSFSLIPLLLLVACSNDIYTRDGVTDGDTFYLAPRAFSDDDPVLQAWVAYSLMKSACQLEIGGDNPARANSFKCEFSARRHLAGAWEGKPAKHPVVTDNYLVKLVCVRDAGFLAEYTVKYFGQDDWLVPEGLRSDRFQRWQRQHLHRHKPQTRIIGSWNYRR